MRHSPSLLPFERYSLVTADCADCSGADPWHGNTVATLFRFHLQSLHGHSMLLPPK